MGEDGLFCWSIVMMMFLTADYAAAASLQTCVSLCGKYVSQGNGTGARYVHRTSCLFVAGWCVLFLGLTFLFPKVMLPIFGASDAATYGQLLSLIALSLPLIMGNTTGNQYLSRLILTDRVALYTLLTSSLYLAFPLLLLVGHQLLPGNECWCLLAIVPLQIAAWAIGSRQQNPKNL